MIPNPLPRTALGLAVLCGGAAGCTKTGEAPRKDPPPTASAAASASTVASTGASAERPPPKSALPTLAPETIAATKGFSYYPIEGAHIVVDGLRVGRLVEDKVEWLGALPEMNQALGGSQITGVFGKWPDVDVVFSSNSGRASQPSVYPLTGKGSTVTFGPGGGLGWISGWARLGATTIVGGTDSGGGAHFLTVRGPGAVIKPITAEKGGCKENEGMKPWEGEARAVAFTAVAATEKGTLVTIGNLCERTNTPVAEVWDQPGKSRIIPLGAWVKEVGYFPKLLRGQGDDLWLESRPILHYHDGTFEPLPMPDKRLKALFVSASGKLHGATNRLILRYDAGTWTPIAKLARPMDLSKSFMDEQETIWVAHGGVARLRPVQDAEADENCKTPFVYLYEVSWKNEAKYTFPTTRKALSTFPQVAEISLVEYWDSGRKLGVKVKSDAQGEAVIAHIKANMKDEAPELICYEPRNPRVIDMNAAK